MTLIALPYAVVIIGIVLLLCEMVESTIWHWRLRWRLRRGSWRK